MKPEKAEFVVFEGGVCAGKSTQIELLKPYLSDWKFFREPGGTVFGDSVRDAVQGRHGYKVNRFASLLAYSASRANLIRGVIKPTLEDGVSVGLDRYWYSTYAYQGAEGVPKLYIWLINRIATGGLGPDAVLYYDLPVNIALQRREKRDGHDRYDIMDKDFHGLVRKNYHQLSKRYFPFWETIDASQSEQAVLYSTLQVLERRGIV